MSTGRPIIARVYEVPRIVEQGQAPQPYEAVYLLNVG
jgi:hypothetical protein